MTGSQNAPISDGSYEEYLALYSAINRQTLSTASDHWESVAAALTDVAGGLGASRDGLLANGGWSSDAANTFGAYMDTLVQQTQGLSTAAAALSGGLRHATRTADQLAHNFPPQPPPPSDDPTVRNWTFPDGTTMQGTATDVRNHLTTQARKAVIGVYEDYSHAADRMAQAQAAAPTPAHHIDSGVTPIVPSTTTAGTTRASLRRPSNANPPQPISGTAASRATQSGSARPTVTGQPYAPQPEVSPLMVPQGGSPPTTNTSPWGRASTTGGFPNAGSTLPSQYAPGLPGAVGTALDWITPGRGPQGRSVEQPSSSSYGDDPGIIGGEVGPGTIRRPAAPYDAGELGDGIVGGVPLGENGSRLVGRGTSSFGGRGGFGAAEDDMPGGPFSRPRSGSATEAGSRLNASVPEEGVATPRVRPGAPVEPEERGGMPMYPGGGMGGASNQERERGKRPKYLVQDPEYWMPKQKVVPPVIE